MKQEYVVLKKIMKMHNGNAIELYQNGCTPNPDILCNKYIKFKYFYNFARDNLKADAIATGHYAKTSFGPYLEHFKPLENVKLLKAQDEEKDQTFFLSQIPETALKFCMFPLGEYLKSRVKQIAQEADLNFIAQKKESMGICFIGKREFQHFISQYIPDKPGNFVDLDSGQVVGEHKGFHHWTVGQKIRLGGLDSSYFIYQKDTTTNDIIVVPGTNHPALYSDFIRTEAPHWISGKPPELMSPARIMHCDFRFQHREPVIPCTVHMTLHDQLIIQLSQPLRAITNGQFAVLYKGEECLGSAVISFSGPSYFALNKEVPMEYWHKYNENMKAQVAI
ncbi:mitochondrial tRNA-specific 2-thiouridylase 1 isoform X2 [Megachile rotundata]|uniref:mitochondrial tRNA-specific 2-thiouridylase 1 isoform X2 n=1 Tax=Megachile rotundata TaxID=143995 RepID=UPI0006153C8E|nr:PREDICTED: mitochondrial tRNA-specific 2-thiouridylase 1 isoform X2 [Megachile rotundata]